MRFPMALFAVIALFVVAYGFDPRTTPTPEALTTAAVTGVTTAPSTQAAPAGQKTDAVSDQYANEQCPVPKTRGGAQEVYAAAEQPQPGFFTGKDKKRYYNLYGTQCEGIKLRKGKCTAEKFCNGNVPGAECQISATEWGPCKKEPTIKVASNDQSIGLPTSQDLAKTPVADTPPPPADKVTGSDKITDAYKTPTAQQPPAVPASTANNPTPTASALDKVASAQVPPPASSQPSTAPSGPALTPGNTGNIASNAPGSPQPGTPPISRTYTPPTTPSSQTTFPGQQTSNPSGRTGSRFSNFFSNLSVQTFFNGLTSFVDSVVSPSAQQYATNNNVNIVQTVVQNTSPSLQRVVIVQQVSPVSSTNTFGAPPARISEINYRVSARAIDLGIPGSDPVLTTDLDLSTRQRTTFDAITIERPARGSSPSDLRGPIYEEGASTSTLDLFQAYEQRPTQYDITKVTEPDFSAASTSAQSTSLVERFHAISIPDLLSAITQGSFDLIRRVISRGQPENPISITQSGSPRVETVFGDDSSELPSSSSIQVDQVRPADNARSDSGASARVETREKYTERLEKDSGAVFKDASIAHQVDGYVPVERPAFKYEDILPVPEPIEYESNAPTFVELVVKNGAKEIQKLFTTIWRFILPGSK